MFHFSKKNEHIQKKLLFIFDKLDIPSISKIFSKISIKYDEISLAVLKDKMNDVNSQEYFQSFDKVLLFLRINKAIESDHWKTICQKLNDLSSKNMKKLFIYAIFHREKVCLY